MSSHHVVKAKQEPALLILSLKGFDEEYLGQLLEWSPTIVVSEEVYEEVESLGIKIDLIVGSLEPSQSDVKVLASNGQNNLTGLSYLIDEGYPAVNIIAEEVIGLESIYYDEINIVWYCASSKFYRIKSGFRVWKPSGTTYKISKVEGLKTVNLESNNFGEFSVVEDGFVTFNFSNRTLLIEELL